MKPHAYLILLTTVLLSFPLCAQGEEATPPKSPPVEKIGETTYLLGGITFDSATREIRIPTKVIIRDGGPLEYVLVHEDGKVHETLLATAVNPFDLQIVLKLLRYKDGMGDVLAPMLPAEERATALTKREERGDAVEINVEWMDGDEKESTLVQEWIADNATRAAIDSTREDAHWVHTGSYFSDAGGFLAEVEGSIIGLYLDPGAIFNTPLEGSDDDERWGANGLATPPLETDVTIVIQPKKMSQLDREPAN